MTREIPLTRGLVALVDDEDYEELSKYPWHAVYRAFDVRAARNTGDGHKTMMATAVSGFATTSFVNGNTLDCRRANLREATRTQVRATARKRTGLSSIYKGVTLHSPPSRWVARIGYNNRMIYLGYFGSEVDAAHAYDNKATELFGEFAVRNFPLEGQRSALD